MNTFYLIVQKTLIATTALCFAFVTLYTPQIHVTEVEQASASMDATEPTQWVNMGLLTAGNVLKTAMTGFLGSLQMKELVLDPIAWLAAKGVISTITNSVVSWINSGFNGAPMFVQDMKNYMNNISDRLGSEMVDELSVAPYVADAFRINVQAAFAKAYIKSRDGSPRNTIVADTAFNQKLATLSSGSFGANSWDDWFKVVDNPQTYTPYGNVLAVKEESERRIAEAQTNEKNLLTFGDGFISNKVCKTSNVTGSSKETCSVVSPGQTISETLNLQLGSGVNSLIAADEISEILASLLAQLGKMAISGASGLLGLSSGTGFTDVDPNTGNSIVDQMQIDQQKEQGGTTDAIKKLAKDSLAIENKFEPVANAFSAAFTKLYPGGNGTLSSINSTISSITSNKTALQTILNSNKPSSELLKDYNDLTTLHKELDITNSQQSWIQDAETGIRAREAEVRSYYNSIISTRSALQNIVSSYTATAARKTAAQAAITEINNTILPNVNVLLTNLNSNPGGNGVIGKYVRREVTEIQAMNIISGLNIPTDAEKSSNLARWNAI